MPRLDWTGTGQALLEAALAQSGLSLRQFAMRYLARDERTARRWRAGTSPIPQIVQWWLREYLAGRGRDGLGGAAVLRANAMRRKDIPAARG